MSEAQHSPRVICQFAVYPGTPDMKFVTRRHVGPTRYQTVNDSMFHDIVSTSCMLNSNVSAASRLRMTFY